MYNNILTFVGKNSNMKHTLLYILGGCLLTAACTEKPRQYAPEPVKVLYHNMAEYAHADSARRAEIEATDTAELHAFFRYIADGRKPDSLMIRWSHSLAVAVFTPAVDSVYADTDTLSRRLGYILGRADDLNLELPHRSYAAVVWGKRESIAFVDSVMLIALNHYLGQEYEGYSEWPVYRRFVKAPDFMPYDIAEALVGTQYPYEEREGGTALSRLLYEGALTQAKMELVPDARAPYALGYRDEQYNFLAENEAQLWQTLVASDMMFDTSGLAADRLVSPAPNTSVLDVRAPGRAGRYLGWKIVKAYLQRHPETTLRTLLSPDFYHSPDALAQSGYTGS